MNKISIGIYRIINKINNKSYIGQSVNIERRIKTHFWAAYKEQLPSYNYHIYQAIRKYGKENFSFEILETLKEIDIEKMNQLEINYIQLYDSFKNGYNMNSGGDNSEQNLNSGQKNSHAKLTKQDVKNIREAYNRHEIKKDVYEKYKEKIGISGFNKIWTWKTWKTILSEYHNKENILWYSTKGKSLPSDIASLNAGKINREQIYSIRELYDENISAKDIKKILELPISVDQIREIGKRKKFISI